MILFQELALFPSMVSLENLEAGVEATQWCVYLVHLGQCTVSNVMNQSYGWIDVRALFLAVHADHR